MFDSQPNYRSSLGPPPRVPTTRPDVGPLRIESGLSGEQVLFLSDILPGCLVSDFWTRGPRPTPRLGVTALRVLTLVRLG